MDAAKRSAAADGRRAVGPVAGHCGHCLRSAGAAAVCYFQILAGFGRFGSARAGYAGALRMNIYLVTGAVLLVYLILVWFLGNILHLHGRDIWVLRIGLGLIGILGPGTFLWFKRRGQKLPAGAQGSTQPAGPAREQIVGL